MIPDELLSHCYRMEKRFPIRDIGGCRDLDVEEVMKEQCANQFARDLLRMEDFPITINRPANGDPDRTYYKMEITRYVLSKEMMIKFFDYARTGVWNDG